MADTVTARLLADGVENCVVHLTGISDATGEAAVKKVDITTVAKVLKRDGTTVQPVSLDIEAVRWSIQGYKSVQLLWDHTADDTALVLAAGTGYEDFAGPARRSSHDLAALLTDPRSTGGDGSILLTSNGAAAGASYDITLWLRKASA